jgi:orotidine-5'-phosphate decarboxylase
MPRNFADRLLDAIDAKQNPSCVGLDPVVIDIPDFLKLQAIEEFGLYEKPPYERVEESLKATSEVLFRFNKAIIDTTNDIIPIFKPNIAFYECYGPEGIRAFWRTVDYARQKAMVIADVKREDIGKTAKFYADGLLGSVELIDGTRVSGLNADAVTLGPYIGSDSIGEFVKVCLEYGKGAFILDRTSNPSAGEIQDQRLAEVHGGRTIYEQMALLIDLWGSALKGERGYSSLGAVVGANFPVQAERIREMIENGIILVPAYGSQGGTGKDAVPNFNADGYGAVVNNSSSLIFAYKRDPYKSRFRPGDFDKAAREAALAMRVDIVGALQGAGRLPSGWERV